VKLTKPINRKEIQAMKEQLALSGVIACRGQAKGRPVIVRAPSDLDLVLEGDILVAVETDISFVPAMFRASAIVTETGGRWCHAAVWARENKKPTIIQVEAATEVLQDIEAVKVNADLGIVEWEA
jgi:pyruvate,water dikinase